MSPCLPRAMRSPSLDAETLAARMLSLLVRHVAQAQESLDSSFLLRAMLILDINELAQHFSLSSAWLTCWLTHRKLAAALQGKVNLQLLRISSDRKVFIHLAPTGVAAPEPAPAQPAQVPV